MAGNRTLKLSILADVDDLNKKLKAANGDVEKSATGLEKFGKVAGAAFLAAAAAAGAYALKIGVDGVKAALADEQSQVKLASALTNATKATKAQIAATEESIDKMARATGVADDNLRPALARLALSTGNVSKAQDLLSLALDISTQTGKPLEGVANALGKAYDGNSAALGRLGIGLTAAELKAMSFTDVQRKLSELFGGAAAKNAETFQGRMDRLKVAFDEGVETIGYNLLPIIQKFIDLIVNKVIPDFQKFIKLFDPLKQAISDNKESFQALGSFIVDYIVPVFTVALGGAITFVAKIAAGVVDIVGGVINVIRTLVSGAIDGINALIKAYNSIPVLPNIPTIPKPSFTTPTVSAPRVSTPTYTAPTISAPSGSGSTGGSGGSGGGSTTLQTAAAAASSAAAGIGSFNAGRFRMGEERTSGDTYNITVTGAFDKEGVARQIVEILNDSTARGGGGGSGALQIA
jgi:phage-related protein